MAAVVVLALYLPLPALKAVQSREAEPNDVAAVTLFLNL